MKATSPARDTIDLIALDGLVASHLTAFAHYESEPVVELGWKEEIFEAGSIASALAYHLCYVNETDGMGFTFGRFSGGLQTALELVAASSALPFNPNYVADRRDRSETHDQILASFEHGRDEPAREKAREFAPVERGDE